MKLRNLAIAAICTAMTACSAVEKGVEEGSAMGGGDAYSATAWNAAPLRAGDPGRKFGRRQGFLEVAFATIYDTDRVSTIMREANKQTEPSAYYIPEIFKEIRAGRVQFAPCAAVHVRFSETRGMLNGAYIVRDYDGNVVGTTDMHRVDGYPESVVNLVNGAAVLVVPTGPILNTDRNPRVTLQPFDQNGAAVIMPYAPNLAPRHGSTPGNSAMGIANALQLKAAPNGRGAIIFFLVVPKNACDGRTS